MAEKSPQEKKALSYVKDRRNAYGENDKASRNAIPLRKRLVNRANRHDIQRQLSDATGPLDGDLADAAEQRALGKRPKRWSKSSDKPLGQYLDDKSARKTKQQAQVPNAARPPTDVGNEPPRGTMHRIEVEPRPASSMSTHAIKTELQELLTTLRPDKKWPKRVSVTDLCDYTVSSISADSKDEDSLRALRMAHVLYDHERR